MAERRDVPGMDVGEQLRRIIAQRRWRRRRLVLAGLIGCSTIPLVASVVWKPRVLLVWNASASAPVGLYRLRAEEPVRRGDMVVAWTPEPFRSLAATRRYLPANVPLVKRIAAATGDRVCAVDNIVSINGRRVATRQQWDAAQRPMPRWSGCHRLNQGEYFLLMDSPLSFDGRYFGVTQRQNLVGRAVLLWAKPAKGSNDG